MQQKFKIEFPESENRKEMINTIFANDFGINALLAAENAKTNHGLFCSVCDRISTYTEILGLGDNLVAQSSSLRRSFNHDQLRACLSSAVVLKFMKLEDKYGIQDFVQGRNEALQSEFNKRMQESITTIGHLQDIPTDIVNVYVGKMGVLASIGKVREIEDLKLSDKDKEHLYKLYKAQVIAKVMNDSGPEKS